MGSVLCEHCTGQCCRYIAFEIDPPESKRDFDDMRWYLLHEGVALFVEDNEWYIQFATNCRHLQPDYRCGIYETRPKICREYSTDECEYHAGEYEYQHLFTQPEQLDVFAEEFLRRKAARTAERGRRRRLRRRRGAIPMPRRSSLVQVGLPSKAAV